jgi:predicted GNAT superfamily acetyltransferase
LTDGITVRALLSPADRDACVALQRETWGRSFADVVPASILQVSQKVGGVAAGAFDTGGQLLGFVFGITGVEDGEIVHWSDMLAVRASARNRGIGRRLKEFQRGEVARVGGKVIYWTFDPLVARNAHLNINVFGARAVHYVKEMYGQITGSDLHRGIGTDRLIVSWPVDADKQEEHRRAAASVRDASEAGSAPLLGDFERLSPPAGEVVAKAARLRIAVPADVEPMLVKDEAKAVMWRKSTRQAFETAWEAGFRIDGFRLDPGNARGFYLLSRASAAGGAPST